MNLEKAAKHYKAFMREVGIDLKSPHAVETPMRVAKMFKERTVGMRELDFEFKAFPCYKGRSYDTLVVEKDIPFYSMCAHHHVTFFGKASVAYLPSDKIIGLSKIVRAVKWVASKPTIQEDLTEEIADLLEKELSPRAVCVYVEAEHLCVASRGIKAAGVKTVTHCIRGQLGTSIKGEFLSLIGKR